VTIYCALFAHEVQDSIPDPFLSQKQTFAKIKQNLAWAFAYNLVGIPIAAGVLLPFSGLCLTPSVAGGLMGFSSLGVMANSLTLRLAGRRLSKPPPVVAKEKDDGNADASPDNV
jgi:Cu+-exporting ATPase